MNNAELNQFAKVPTNQTLKRSVFDLSHKNLFTAKVGKLIPFESIEILPGDTISMDQSQVLRSLTPMFPTMDNAFVDFFYFFIPNRLCYADGKYQLDQKIWEQMNGENTHSFWAQDTEVEAMTEAIGEIKPQSICDYLDLPLGDFHTDEQINIAQIIAVGLVWNEFFRDQNVMNPIVDWQTFCQFAREDCLNVSKFHDYFTSALPGMQKGNPITIALGQNAPIEGGASVIGDRVQLYSPQTGTNLNLAMIPLSENGAGDFNDAMVHIFETKESSEIRATFGHKFARGEDPAHVFSATQGFPREDLHDSYLLNIENPNIDISNLRANLAKANPISINDLRLAFAMQKSLERDARSGTRFIEQLKARWNVTIRDDTLQRPQYIGGKRIPLNIQQVNQTSESTENAPLGRSGAFSLTSGQNITFTASFKESGYLIGFMCIRLCNTYKHGIPLKWSRKKRFDFYNPEFANVGEMPIRNKELYFSDDDQVDNEVFGYKEAWAEYRYGENHVKGYFKDPDELILKGWTYTQDFAELPTLNSDFIEQKRDPFLKTLAVSETDYDYIVDIWHNCKGARPMPTYSIPSLIDHN